MANSKPDIISFKVDHELMGMLKHVANRSEFIRAAVLAALDSTCPLCNGSGILQSHERKHWDQFASSHPQEECSRCESVIFTCGGKQARHACQKKGHVH
jgi:hypothetical protein